MGEKEIYNCIDRFIKNLKNENIDCSNLDIDLIIKMYKMYSENK